MPDALEVTVRTLITIGVLFLATKLLGKRQISQLTLFEYITGITIGDIAGFLSLDLKSDWYLALIALGLWIFVSLGFEFLQLKSKKARDFLDSKGTVLIQDGKVLEDNLKKERLTSDELLHQLRNKNAFRVADVEFAIMEPSGQINVLLKSEHLPITPNKLGVKVGPSMLPMAVILDGSIIDDSLMSIGLSREWLQTELKKIGVTVENVFLGQVDGYGELFVDLYDDKLKVPEPQQRAALFATLKKCEADIEMFALSSKEKNTKSMYGECAQQLEQLIAEVRPFLTR